MPLPPEIEQALLLLTGNPPGGIRSGFDGGAGLGLGGGGGQALTASSETVLGGVGGADQKLLDLFVEAVRQGPEAVKRFFSRYGSQMDVATWMAVTAIVEGRYTGPDDPLRKYGIFEIRGDTSDEVRRGAFSSGVYIPTEPVTWQEAKDNTIAWFRSPEGLATEPPAEPADVDKLIADAEAGGANAVELAELETLRSPAARMAAVDISDLLQYNPHVAGFVEIPAGTPIFLGARTLELGAGESLQDAAARVGEPVERIIAYQREHDPTFDPDKLYPGQPIFLPPSGYGAPGGEQTVPIPPRTEPHVSPEVATPPSFTPAVANPFLPGPYGEDYLSRILRTLGIPEVKIDEIARDPNRSYELASALMNAQYGRSGGGPGMFGGYLRGQAGNIGTMLALFDILNIGGGSEARGGGYRTFEDIYESLGAGVGTARPEDFSISDWRNLLYGGVGAAAPGGLLGGGREAQKLEPESLEEAEAYLNDLIRPLMSSTIGEGRWKMLMELLPDLWIQFNQETGGEPGGGLWAQWLQKGGYLPSMIGR